MPADEYRGRITLVRCLFLLGFAVVSARLVQLHLQPQYEFPDHVRYRPITIPRGNVYDRSGELLITDKRVPSLWANPREISDPEGVANALSARLDVDRDTIYARLTRRTSRGDLLQKVWIKRWLTDEELSALGELADIAPEGLAFDEELTRFYRERDLAAHVLGFTNREAQGGGGVELAFNEYLSSTPGKRSGVVDRRSNFIPSLTQEYVAPQGGHHVYLTIDAVIQHRLEEELDKTMERCKAPRAMGIVMDPDTGAILAMACRPAFDPNHYWDHDTAELKNRALVDVFEPGSAFKIVTTAAVLEHGLVTPDTLIDTEKGVYHIGRRRIRDFHKFKEEPIQPLSMCFAESSNIAMVKLAALLGPEAMEAWINRFGFGERTSRDFAGESRGIFRPREEWSGYSMGSLPMGQEIAVTMPQLARAFSAIANGGIMVEPHVVAQVVSRDGEEVYRHRPERIVRIMSEQTAATMRELCHLVITHGTGERASIEEYRVGGKTGTAQIAVKDGRGYSEKNMTVFAGFAPVSDPKITAVIVVPEPNIRLAYGGYVCGPVFREVVREALIKMHCPPDPVVDEDEDGHAAPVVDTAQLAQADFEPFEPDPEELLEPLRKVKLVPLVGDVTSNDAVLPDLAGLTKRQAKKKLAGLGIHADMQGAGWVVSQEPPAGTPLEVITLCRLHCESRKPNDDEQDDDA